MLVLSDHATLDFADDAPSSAYDFETYVEAPTESDVAAAAAAAVAQVEAGVVAALKQASLDETSVATALAQAKSSVSSIATTTAAAAAAEKVESVVLALKDGARLDDKRKICLLYICFLRER